MPEEKGREGNTEDLSLSRPLCFNQTSISPVIAHPAPSPVADDQQKKKNKKKRGKKNLETRKKIKMKIKRDRGR